MLELREIVKDYVSKENVVHVLKGVNLRFRKALSQQMVDF